jgi:HTH-type transcriptional regulator / antitoxin HipB
MHMADGLTVRTPAQIGAAVRGLRTERGISQQALAARAGVSRRWLIEFEHGKARAELSRVLRVIAALDHEVALTPATVTDQLDDVLRGEDDW